MLHTKGHGVVDVWQNLELNYQQIFVHIYTHVYACFSFFALLMLADDEL